MFTYAIIVGGWIALWFSPRAAVLNLGGLVLALWLLAPVALVATFTPTSLRELLLWWTAYMAVFLSVGAIIIAYRRKRVAADEGQEPILANFDLVTPARQTFFTIAKIVVPLALLMAIILSGIALSRGEGLEALRPPFVLAFLVAAGPLVPIALFWGIAVVVHWLRDLRKR